MKRMPRTHTVSAALAGLALMTAGGGVLADDDALLWAALAEGGKVVMMRHASPRRPLQRCRCSWRRMATAAWSRT
jgi:hypothetical protein